MNLGEFTSTIDFQYKTSESNSLLYLTFEIEIKIEKTENSHSQWAKSPKKQSVGVYFTVFECRINKNALLQIVFLASLPTGL